MCTTLALVFAGGARDDGAPEEEVSAGDGTWRCGVRANKGFYWKEVGLVTVVLGWLLFGFVGVFFGGQLHGTWSGGVEESKTGKAAGKAKKARAIQGRRQYVFVNFYSHLHTPPSHAQPLGGVRLGGLTGEPGWAQAVQQLCPAPGHYGAVLALDWWKVHGVSGTVYLSLQALWVHIGLKLLEGPLFPDGHRRSQLAQSWWQGR